MIEYFLMAFFVTKEPSLAATPPAAAPIDQAVSPSELKPKVVISAPRFQATPNTLEAIWSGGVKVKRGDTRLSCERLVVTYTRTQEIKALECIGTVEVNDGDRWAKGERALFDNQKGILEVTGSPEARQGPNRMRGSKVIFFMNRNLLEVQNVEADIETPKNGVPSVPLPGAPAKKK